MPKRPGTRLGRFRFALVKAEFVYRLRESPSSVSYTHLIGAILIYGLTNVPAIKGFMGTDRLLLLDGVIIALVALAGFQLWKIVDNKIIKRNEDFSVWMPLAIIVLCGAGFLLTYVQPVREILVYVDIPVATYLSIVLLCVFNNMLPVSYTHLDVYKRQSQQG